MKKIAIFTALLVGAPFVVFIGSASTAGIISGLAGTSTPQGPVATITMDAVEETPSFKVAVPPVDEEPEVEIEKKIVVPVSPAASKKPEQSKKATVKIKSKSTKVVTRKTQLPKAVKSVKKKKASGSAKSKGVSGKFIWPGANCAPAGAKGVSAKGVTYICKKKTPSSKTNKWLR